MLRYAPDVASRFGLTAEQAEELERQEAALMEAESLTRRRNVFHFRGLVKDRG